MSHQKPLRRALDVVCSPPLCKDSEKEPPNSVHALIFRNQCTEIIVVQKLATGKWGLPGGKINYLEDEERHESPEEAMKRELFEEVGIRDGEDYSMTSLGLSSYSHSDRFQKDYVVRLFRVELFDPTAPLRKVGEGNTLGPPRWMELSQMQELAQDTSKRPCANPKHFGWAHLGSKIKNLPEELEKYSRVLDGNRKRVSGRVR